MKVLLFVAALVALTACGAPTNDVVTPTNLPCITIGPRTQPSSATLHPGDTLRVSVILPPCSSTLTTFRWFSSDSSIAMVDSLSGLIRARAVGTVTMVATAVADPNFKTAMLLVVAQ